MALSLKLARLLLATRAGLALFLPTEKRVKRGFELDEGWGILDIWFGWVWRGYKGGGLRNASETGDEGVGVFVRPGPGSEGGQVVSRERRAGRWKHEERGRVESRPESQTRAKKSGKRGGKGEGGLDAMMRELYMFYGAKDPSSTPPFVGVTAVPRRAAVNPAHAPHRSAHPITAAAATPGPRNASPVPRIRSLSVQRACSILPSLFLSSSSPTAFCQNWTMPSRRRVVLRTFTRPAPGAALHHH